MQSCWSHCASIYPPRQSLHCKVLLKDQTSKLAQFQTGWRDLIPGISVFPLIFSPNNKLNPYQSPLLISSWERVLLVNSWHNTNSSLHKMHTGCISCSSYADWWLWEGSKKLRGIWHLCLALSVSLWVFCCLRVFFSSQTNYYDPLEEHASHPPVWLFCKQWLSKQGYKKYRHHITLNSELYFQLSGTASLFYTTGPLMFQSLWPFVLSTTSCYSLFLSRNEKPQPWELWGFSKKSSYVKSFMKLCFASDSSPVNSNIEIFPGLCLFIIVIYFITIGHSFVVLDHSSLHPALCTSQRSMNCF